MKNYLKYILSAFISIGLLTGCLPDKAEKALVYKGPTVVEIKNQKLGVLATVLTKVGVYTSTAQTDSTRTVLLASRGTDSILVQLVGPQSSSPTDVIYTVRPVSTTLTAQEGVNYTFVPAGARTVTIPPNSSSAYIQVKMIPGSIPTTETSRALAIDLVGNSQVGVSANYGKFILTLRR
ncbi:hypothetical protein [Mucilaginibacter sp.]